MLYFLDTEFIELGASSPNYLLSIGVITEDGREYYAENAEAPIGLANTWVREHVFPHLKWKHQKSLQMIRQDILAFLDREAIFWGYYCDYDWVIFCQNIFGRMVDIPDFLPKYCNDLRQHLNSLGLVNIRQPDDAPHNALSDARWIRDTYLQYKEAA